MKRNFGRGSQERDNPRRETRVSTRRATAGTRGARRRAMQRSDEDERCSGPMGASHAGERCGRVTRASDAGE